MELDTQTNNSPSESIINNTIYKPKIPSINLATSNWRKIAPAILNTANALVGGISTKIAENGSVRL